ncbi:MAG TPA: HEAT repeat domain-containing protein [Phototrophicaceae bacterium]|nr:HEAT repeat domain-containing protein [Phototrophicaceae bacterium]
MTFADDHETREKPSLETAMAALQIQDMGIISADIYYGLSNLSAAEITQLKPVWETLTPEYRRSVMQELAEASEVNFELNYQALGWLGLDDDDAEVREAAISALWLDESTELMARLIKMAQWDDNSAVRATAVSDLGRFILLGEYGELTDEEANQIQDVVVNLLTDDQEDLEVRRRALESIANSSHAIVNEAIEEAYESHERLMQVSAVFAMGRTCDERWRDQVLRELDNDDAEIRYEAARAAGEIGFIEAIPALGRLAVDPDRETQNAAIWSLGEIGGNEALRILTALADRLQDAEDAELIETVEEAIGAASLVGGELDFDLLDIDTDFEDFEDDEELD